MQNSSFKEIKRKKKSVDIFVKLKMLFVFSLCLPSLNSIAQIPMDQLAAFYPFNGNANDMSGNGNHGTVSGATLTADRCNVPNSAYYFNGSSSILIPHSPSLNNNHYNELTVAFWAYFISPGVAPICKASWANSAVDYRMHFYSNDILSIICGGKLLEVDCPIPRNQWIHIAFVYQNGRFKIYKNGTLLLQQNGEETVYGCLVTTDLTIGADPHGDIEYTEGKLDDIYIFNKALTDVEINCLYTQPCPRTDTITLCNGESVTLPNGQTYSTDTIVHSGGSCDSVVFWKINVVDCNPNHKANLDFNTTDNVLNYRCDSVYITLNYKNQGERALKNPYSITVYKDLYRGDTIKTYTIHSALQPNNSHSFFISLPKALLLNYAPISNLIFTLNDSGSGIAQHGNQQEEHDTINNILNLPFLLIPEDSEVEVADVACSKKTYTGYGFTIPPDSIPSSGVFHFQRRLNTMYGCDSIVRLALTTLPNSSISIYDTIQKGKMYTLNGFDIAEQNQGGDFKFHLDLKNEWDCDSIIYLYLHVIQPNVDHSVYMNLPNAFNPHAISNNYFCIIQKYNVKDLNIKIYSRWGELVYQSKNIDFKWNGVDLKGNLIPIGSYVYVIEYHSFTDPNITKQKTGNISVVY